MDRTITRAHELLSGGMYTRAPRFNAPGTRVAGARPVFVAAKTLPTGTASVTVPPCTCRRTRIVSPFERTTDLSDYPPDWADFLRRFKAHIETA